MYSAGPATWGLLLLGSLEFRRKDGLGIAGRPWHCSGVGLEGGWRGDRALSLWCCNVFDLGRADYGADVFVQGLPVYWGWKWDGEFCVSFRGGDG